MKKSIIFAFSLLLTGVFFVGTAFATQKGCVDIMGTTTALVPPDSGQIVFDISGGLPSDPIQEACISDRRGDQFTLTTGEEVFPMKEYAWDDNTGWLQFDWKINGTTFSKNQAAIDMDGYLYGYIWSENVGWIQLDWWRSASYPSGKSTPGVPGVDLTAAAPYPFTGYAWNDSLGWFDLAGATTFWQPPRCMNVIGTTYCLESPSSTVCDTLFPLPYIKKHIDLNKLDAFNINLLTRPKGCSDNFGWNTTDASGKIDGNPPIYKSGSKNVIYKPGTKADAKITVDCTDSTSVGCKQEIIVTDVFKYYCNGSPISYLPECDYKVGVSDKYCQPDCRFKPKPTPWPSPWPSPTPTPAPKFCGDRITNQPEGKPMEQCDRGFYGGYISETEYCTSDCKITAYPKKPEYPWFPESPFEKKENIMPANPLTHYYEACFCLKDMKGNCTTIDKPIKEMKVTVEYENTMLFDQGLDNIRKIQCEGSVTKKDCGGTLSGDALNAYKSKYNKKKEGDFGEAAEIEIYDENNVLISAKGKPTSEGSHKYSATINIEPQSPAKEGQVCVRAKSYMPTSGANAYDENHNGVIDPGDFFFDNKRSDIFRLKLTKMTYDLEGTGINFEYEFDDTDGYYHFRSPIEVTKIDTDDGQNFIHAIVESPSRFLTYVSRVVPDSKSLTYLPSNENISIALGIDRLDLGDIFWFDVDTLIKSLKINTTLLPPGKDPVADDKVGKIAHLWMGLEEEAEDIFCNLGLYCEFYIKPFYQDADARGDQVEEEYAVQVFSEVSFEPVIEIVDLKNRPVTEMRFMSNQFPRGEESAIANPLADIRGTISASSGVYTRREGQVIVTVGDLSTNTVRNTISANVSEIIRGSTIQPTTNKIDLSCEIRKDGKICDGYNNPTGAAILKNGAVIFAQGDVYIGKDGNDAFLPGSFDNPTTLIVKGGDVHIDGNIMSDKRFGIIVLAECDLVSPNKCGGNVYIHPNVTDIYANIYADGSVFSYDEVGKVDDVTGEPILSGSRISTLSNAQLLIKGSISSNNTVGGAVGEEGIYYLGDGLPTKEQDKAILYDLNHLRYVRLKRGTVTDPINKEEKPGFVADIEYRSKGLDAGSSNEAVYVLYVAPPKDLPGFKVEGLTPSGEQVNL